MFEFDWIFNIYGLVPRYDDGEERSISECRKLFSSNIYAYTYTTIYKYSYKLLTVLCHVIYKKKYKEN